MSSYHQHSASFHRSWRAAGLAAVAAAALFLAACTGGGSSPESAATAAEGGSIVIGAEQEPDCTDWLGICGGSIWGAYMMKVTTIPVAFDVRETEDGWAPVASDLLTGEPTVETSGGGQTITYEINPDAVWSDGTPITSADFAYTALQVRDGEDILDKTGYSLITDVATPDPQTAVVSLSSPYAGWKTLFGNSYGVLPAHLLEGQDRNAVMKDGYDFSGGPWLIDSWDKGVSVTLVPNENYWGETPKLDEVTFQFITDTAAAFQAMKSGQVDALFPTPQLNAISQIEAGVPDTEIEVSGDSGNLEAFWINNQAFPFDSEAVRKAFAYGVDRAAIVDRIYGPLGVDEPAQSFISPLVGPFGGTDFDQYSLDPEQVDELMEGDGWAKNEDGVWAKDGQTASFEVVTLAGNARRDLMVQVLQSQLGEVGFEVTVATTTPAELFGEIAPAGEFQVGLWTLVDYFPDPALSASFASTSIPNEANAFSGINFMRVDVPGLDQELTAVDTEIDPAARVEASLAADELLADAAVSLPVTAVPNILMWSTSLTGPISNNPGEGPWWNLEEWALAG
ncbi:MAG: hypothetical protein K0S37_383 [Microbacterium sp.]|jgi:peptide/nickel transport system substrate-binding protein|nr:hypothetical protein [Microbacterium sp.]